MREERAEGREEKREGRTVHPEPVEQGQRELAGVALAAHVAGRRDACCRRRPEVIGATHQEGSPCLLHGL